MLRIRRKEKQSIILFFEDKKVLIQLDKIRSDKSVEVSIEAPAVVKIYRTELLHSEEKND